MNDPVSRYTDLLEHVPCNLCGADDFDVMHDPRYEAARPEEILNTFRSSGDEILVDQLVRCRSCGLHYLNPRLRGDLIIDGYSLGADELFVSQIAARERTFLRSLKKIEPYLAQGGRILDIGTAGGSFLAVAKQRGFEVVGCEPNRWLAEWGSRHYGVPIQAGTLFDMQLAGGSFDGVTLWDVLEHTPDPAAVLQECHRVLKPRGLLVVNYPDINSLVSRLMDRRWVFLLSIHLYYFTKQTVGRMLRESGFEILRANRHWQSLELGYILFRTKPYLPWLSRIGTAATEALRIQHLHIPYWMGQVLVLARRNP